MQGAIWPHVFQDVAKGRGAGRVVDYFPRVAAMLTSYDPEIQNPALPVRRRGFYGCCGFDVSWTSSSRPYSLRSRRFVEYKILRVQVGGGEVLEHERETPPWAERSITTLASPCVTVRSVTSFPEIILSPASRRSLSILSSSFPPQVVGVLPQLVTISPSQPTP